MYSLFDLDLNNWNVIVLSGIPALINVGIFIYVTAYLPNRRINVVFSVYILCLAIAQLSDGFIRMSVNAETAMMWNRITQQQWLLIPSLGLFFTLKFTGLSKQLSHTFLFSVLFLPTIILAMITAANIDHSTVVKSEHWNWIINPSSTFATTLIYFWIGGVAFTMLIILWTYYITMPPGKPKKSQALLLAAGFSIPFFGGVITEVIFPLVLREDNIPLTTPLITVFSVTSIISIRRFNMLDYSPRHQWKTIIETMNEGLLIVDNDDRIMYANKIFCDLMEYEFEEIREKRANELFLDVKDRPVILKAIEERKKGRSGEYEIALKSRTGKKMWFLINGSPYFDRKGNIIGSIGIQTNITRLKELEQTLWHGNARLKSAQSIAHVGSWELNFATGIAIWSEEALRIYGIPEHQHVQSYEAWFSYIHPEDVAFVKKEVERSQMTASDSSFEHRILWRDGTVKFIHSISKFEFDTTGNPIGLFGVCHDITERKQNEKKLAELSERLLLATSSSNIGIFDWDLVKKELVWDDKMYEIYQTTKGCSTPLNIAKTSIFKEDSIILQPEVATALHENKEFHTIFRISAGLQKEMRYIESVGTVLRDEMNNPIRMIGINRDITAQKLAEETIKQSESRIRNFVKHLNKIQEDERAHLAREIHDELGQQLVGIKIGLSSFLKNADDESEKEQIKMMVSTVDETIQALRKIATELRPGILDTLGLASSIEWLGKEFGKKHGVLPEIDINIGSHRYDKNISICFFRICQEALTNISKHANADRIRIAMSQKENELTMIVSDNGTGMGHDKIKNPFSMGLLGMKERARNISGNLKIKSRRGQGTIIHLKAKI